MQSESGVIEQMSTLPLYGTPDDDGFEHDYSKKRTFYEFYARPTISWSLKCDEDPKSDRKEIIKVLDGLTQ